MPALTSDQRTAIRQSAEQMPKSTVIAALLEEIEYKRECQDRIDSLKAALLQTWAQPYGTSYVRCGICLRTAHTYQDDIEHKPDCIVLALPNQGKEGVTE